MPTHPQYPEDLIMQWGDATERVLDYSPLQTPSSVGILSELFRRRRGVQRSHHPLSSVACIGPRTAEILSDNLAPGALPHGAGSAYARIAEVDGLVLSIGGPLINCMTMMHVAEELRDEEWSVAGFFRPRRFRIGQDPEAREWIVRERRPEFVRALALRQVRRDLLREGILNEGSAGPLRLDFARARDVVSYMSLRNRSTPYPYYFPRAATFGAAAIAC
jgi:aminoglycoside 3-N-acetyltransferase